MCLTEVLLRDLSVRLGKQLKRALSSVNHFFDTRETSSPPAPFFSTRTINIFYRGLLVAEGMGFSGLFYVFFEDYHHGLLF